MSEKNESLKFYTPKPGETLRQVWSCKSCGEWGPKLCPKPRCEALRRLQDAPPVSNPLGDLYGKHVFPDR